MGLTSLSGDGGALTREVGSMSDAYGFLFALWRWGRADEEGQDLASWR